MRTEKERQEAKELEAYYKDALKDFAKHYVAIWNALDSLGLTNPQIKGAISNILENSGGTMKDTLQEARQEKNRKAYEDLVKGVKNE